jgi:hypothetical protein
MTAKARNTARRDLRFSSLSGMSTKKIITTIILLSMPTKASAVSLSGVAAAATAFGTFMAPIIQRVTTPVAYAGALKVGLSEVKTFMSDTNTRVYSAIIAAITVLFLLQKVYASRTNRMRISLEASRLAHNAEQRRLNREAMNRMANRQLQMFNRMAQSQGTIVKQAVREAVALTRPMLLQLEDGGDPVVPIPRLTGTKSKSKQN